MNQKPAMVAQRENPVATTTKKRRVVVVSWAGGSMFLLTVLVLVISALSNITMVSQTKNSDVSQYVQDPAEEPLAFPENFHNGTDLEYTSPDFSATQLSQKVRVVETLFGGLDTLEGMSQLDKWRIGAVSEFGSAEGKDALVTKVSSSDPSFADYVKKLELTAVGDPLDLDGSLGDQATIALRDLINGIFGAGINAMSVDYSTLEGIESTHVTDNAPLIGKCIAALLAMGDDFVYTKFNLNSQNGALVDVYPEQLAYYLEDLYEQALKQEEGHNIDAKVSIAQAPENATNIEPSKNASINPAQYFNTQNSSFNGTPITNLMEVTSQASRNSPVVIASTEGMSLGWSSVVIYGH